MSEFDFIPKRKTKDSSVKSQRQLKVGEELRYLISNVLLRETFYQVIVWSFHIFECVKISIKVTEISRI